MVILHIGTIENNTLSGVDVVVPRHLIAQKPYIDCAFYNTNGIKIEQDINQILCDNFEIEKLPKPYNKPDLVVFHEIYHFEYINIYKELVRLGIPYVIIPHSQLTKSAQKRKHLKKVVANIIFFKKFINKAAAIHFLSESEANTSSVKTKKIISTNGIDRLYCGKSFNSKVQKIKYIGRLEMYQKGLDLLIEAISMIHEEAKERKVTFDIFGPDLNGRYERVKNLIETYGVGDIVTLHYEVCGDEKKKELLDTDIFIQTSRFEGMPMGILEALSYGIPCLATQGTTLCNIIDKYKAGITCDNNAKDISKALLKTIDLKEADLKVMSQNSVKLVEENFSWDTIASETIKLYSSLID